MPAYPTPTYKYNVGDVVTVLDGRNIPDYTATFTDEMAAYIGYQFQIAQQYNFRGRPAYILCPIDDFVEDDIFQKFDERGLELFNGVKIPVEDDNDFHDYKK